MKKNFFKKKLASALALALVVASVSPISASAATTAKIVDKSKTTTTAVLYVDKVSYGASAVNFDLSKTYAGTTYTWTVSDSKKATIGAKTGYVVAKAPGVVTVKVAAKNKAGKTTTFTQKVTIRKRATAVAAGDDFTLNSGETKALKATLTPATSTDAVKYVSDKEAVATVDAKTGVVTAVGAGEATITVYAKAASTAPDTSKWNVSDTVKVTVPLGLAKVAQTKGNVLTATFNGSLADKTFSVSNFKIVNDTTKAEYPVKSVSVDGSVVTITTYTSMTDGKVYNVTYGEKTAQFTATDGVVADLTFSPLTVAYGTATEVDVNTVDAKGVIISSYGVAGVTDSKLEFSLSTSQGYVSGSKLVLNAIGNTAKATATYHTYKYDTNGNEVGAITKTATITATDVTAVTVSNYKYTVASSAPSWYSFTQNTKLAVGDNYTFFFTGTKSDDSNVTNADYYFESSNSDILSVGSTNYSAPTLSASLYGITAGSAYVLVKSTSTGAVVYSLPVTILAGRSATNMVLGSLTASLSNTTAVRDTATVSVTKKDQYGATVGSVLATDITVTSLSAPTGVTVAENDQYKRVADGVEFYGNYGTTTAVVAGTYVYKIAVGSLPTQTVTVYVSAPSGSSYTYKLITSASAVDETFGFTANGDVADKAITVKVAVLQGGVLFKYVNLSTLPTGAVTLYNNTTSAAATGSVAGDTLTFTALDVATAAGVGIGGAVTKAAVGSYSVTIDKLPADADPGYLGSVKTSLTGGFTVTDSQSSVSFSRTASSFDIASTPIIAANQNALALEVAKGAYTFTYQGADLVNATAVLSATGNLNGSTLTVKTVTVGISVNLGGTTYVVPVTVSVYQSVNVY